MKSVVRTLAVFALVTAVSWAGLANRSPAETPSACPGTVVCPLTGERICTDLCPLTGEPRPDCPGTTRCPLNGQIICIDRCPLDDDESAATQVAPVRSCCATKG